MLSAMKTPCYASGAAGYYAFTMEAALLEPAAEIPDVLLEPLVRLNRWATRHRRMVDDTQLQAAAWGLIGAFDDLLDLAVNELSIRLNVPADEEELRGGLESAEEIERLDVLLESVRNIRAYVSGTAAETLRRALRSRAPSLSKTFEDKYTAAVARLDDWERWLVLLGAGADEDADIGRELVPPVPEDLPIGSNAIRFDL